MQDFRSLLVWQKAHHLVLAGYKVTAQFPAEERFGLLSQMRRAGASIPSNIAEGCGRGSNAELLRFLQIAMGSASELEYQLLLAHDLGYLPSIAYDRLEADIVEVKRMLYGFMRSIRNAQ